MLSQLFAFDLSLILILLHFPSLASLSLKCGLEKMSHNVKVYSALNGRFSLWPSFNPRLIIFSGIQFISFQSSSRKVLREMSFLAQSLLRLIFCYFFKIAPKARKLKNLLNVIQP